jgi:hypothetical protein
MEYACEESCWCFEGATPSYKLLLGISWLREIGFCRTIKHTYIVNDGRITGIQ